MKFQQINEHEIHILDDKNNMVGQIFSPSSSGNDVKNAIQICGFSEAFDLWGCGVFKGFKDIQLLFDGKKMEGNFDERLEGCLRCYMGPCQCEESDESKIPFKIKSCHELENRFIKE